MEISIILQSRQPEQSQEWPRFPPNATPDHYLYSFYNTACLGCGLLWRGDNAHLDHHVESIRHSPVLD